MKDELTAVHPLLCQRQQEPSKSMIKSLCLQVFQFIFAIIVANTMKKQYE